MRGIVIVVLLVAIVLAAVTGDALADPTARIYWNEYNSYNPDLCRIARSNVDGSGVETVIDGLTDGMGVGDLAIDPDAGKLYWGNRGLAILERANLDGTDRETLCEGVYPVGVDLDLTAGKIYWTDYTYNDPRICRADLDGSDLEVLAENLGDGCVLEGLVLDTANGYMYWAERMDQQIKRANLDGSGVYTLMHCADGIGHPCGLALAAGRLYWSTSHEIYTATLAGDDVRPVIEDLPDLPRSLEYDPDAGKLYWVTFDFYNAAIQRMNLDGTGLETLVEGLNYGYGLALETGPPIAAPDVTTAAVTVGNQPNPFNPATTIRFALPTAQHVRLEILGLDGAHLLTLVDAWRPAGTHEVWWGGVDAAARALPSGVYLGRLASEGSSVTHRMTLVR